MNKNNTINEKEDGERFGGGLGGWWWWKQRDRQREGERDWGGGGKKERWLIYWEEVGGRAGGRGQEVWRGCDGTEMGDGGRTKTSRFMFIRCPSIWTLNYVQHRGRHWRWIGGYFGWRHPLSDTSFDPGDCIAHSTGDWHCAPLPANAIGWQRHPRRVLVLDLWRWVLKAVE